MRYTDAVARKRKVADTADTSGPSQLYEAPEPKKARYDGRPPASNKNMNGKQPRTRGPKDKEAASEQRRLRRIDERNSDTTCFACREVGHNARDCPNAVAVEEGKSIVGICYRGFGRPSTFPRCGSDRHSLKRCRKRADPSNPLPFASCFVCSGKGHLAGQCPENTRGLYPDGGCCKLCGEVDHLAKNCTLRSAPSNPTSSSFLGITNFDQSRQDAGADEDDFHVLKRRTTQISTEEKEERRKEVARARAEKATTSKIGLPPVRESNGTGNMGDVGPRTGVDGNGGMESFHTPNPLLVRRNVPPHTIRKTKIVTF